MGLACTADPCAEPADVDASDLLLEEFYDAHTTCNNPELEFCK